MRKKVLIVMGYMVYGGIQKSLITFLENIKDKAEVDLLLWGRAKEEMELPKWVNVLKVPTVKSVRGALKENGLFSRSFILSCLGVLRKKRWKVMCKLKKRYDVAIAYLQVGFPKYYVIDKVKAAKKYAFYHHGSYDFSEKIKAWDLEYYPKYDKLYCVSSHVRDLLSKTLQADISYDVMPNFINVEEITCLGKENYIWQGQGLKILTVARLSYEKNILKTLSIAKRLKDDGLKFSWLIVGDGSLYAQAKQKIEEDSLQNQVILLGNQNNPYKFMKNCDVYVQLSLFEADPITIKETAIFNKPMVLSNIIAFQNLKKDIQNITLCETDDEIVEGIKKAKSIPYKVNNLANINKVSNEKLGEILCGK